MELALFSVYKGCVGGVWVCTSCKFSQRGLKKLISCYFLWKSLSFVKFLARICDKKFNENSRQCILSLNVKSTTFSWKVWLNFFEIGEILIKNSEKWWLKSTEFTLFSRKFKPRYPLLKNENQKIFLILYSTLEKLSNDTSLNSLRWIYRSAKINWTKKNPVQYIVPPPLKRGRNNCYSSDKLRAEKWSLNLYRNLFFKNIKMIFEIQFILIIIFQAYLYTF